VLILNSARCWNIIVGEHFQDDVRSANVPAFDESYGLRRVLRIALRRTVIGPGRERADLQF